LIFYISKLFTSFLLPPGIFIAALFAAALYAKKYRKIFMGFAFIFLIFSIRAFSNLLLSPLEKPYEKPFVKNEKAQAVVVLAGGSLISSPNLPLYPGAFKRLIYAIMIAKKNNLPLIYTGSDTLQKDKSSYAVKKTLKQLQEYLNIPLPVSEKIKNEFCIIIENESLDTYQNALFTKRLFEKNGIKNPYIYLVTSAYHMKRATILFKNMGFRPIPEATDFQVNEEVNYSYYLPTFNALTSSFLALHEYFGILKAVLLRGMKI